MYTDITKITYLKRNIHNLIYASSFTFIQTYTNIHTHTIYYIYANPRSGMLFLLLLNFNVSF